MENKLTAEEAIEILTKSKNIRDKFDPRKNTIYSEAITMAIEALQSKPKQGGLTAEEMLNKHIDWADAPFGMPMKSIIKAMHEYALQSQPPTVTDEEIDEMIKPHIYKGIEGFGDGLAIEAVEIIMSELRNKLTPNK